MSAEPAARVNRRATDLDRERLHRLTAALATAGTVAQVVEVLVRDAKRLYGADAAGIAVLDRTDGAFRYLGLDGVLDEVGERWQRFPATPDTPYGEAVRAREPLYFETQAAIVRDFPTVAEPIAQGQVQSLVVVPLLDAHGRPLAAAHLQFTTPRRFDASQRASIQTLAQLLGPALERAQLFEAERAAAERVRLALAAGAIVGTWDWDLRTDRITVDERFAESFGIDPALGRTGLSLEQVVATVHPDDLDGLRAEMERAVARSGPYSRQYRVRGRDGVYRWIEANGRVDHDAQGRPWRFPGVLLDVDGRRALEHERDRATGLLRAVLEAVPGVVYAKDRDGRMLIVNQGTIELVGKPREAILGRTDAEFLDDPVQAAAVMANDRRIMDGGVAEQLEEEVSLPDGRRAVWLSSKAPFRDASGATVGIVGASVDITERKSVEARLRRSEARFRQLVENGAVGLVIGDASGALAFVNDALLAMLGYTRDEVDPARGGRPLYWRDLTPPELVGLDERAIAELDARGRTEPYEKVYLAKDGRRVPILVGPALLDPSPEGRKELAAFIVDLTAREKAEAALREADRRKDEFLAMLAHELRNPLAPLANVVKLLQRPDLPEARQRELIGIAERQIRQLRRLVDDLLEVSRITRGKIELRPERMSLTAAIHHAVEVAMPDAEALGHEVRVEVPARPIMIVADPVRVAQVLGNLLNNACKYTPAGGRILISADDGDDEVTVCVRDDGVGIEPENLASVFELFSQVGTTLDRAKGGLGIGLAMVDTLVRMHGGRVSAHSDGPGTGATFTVVLPRAPGTGGSAPTPARGTDAPGAVDGPTGPVIP